MAGHVLKRNMIVHAVLANPLTMTGRKDNLRIEFVCSCCLAALAIATVMRLAGTPLLPIVAHVPL